MNKYKGVVFFDVDGTLIDCYKDINQPTEKTKYAIKKLKESGYLVMIATGRPMTFLTDDLLSLGLSGYIASNGSYCEINEQIIFNHPIENKKLKKLISYLTENNIEYIMEGQVTNCVRDINSIEMTKLLEALVVTKDTFTDKWDMDKIQSNKVVICSTKPGIFTMIKDKFKDEYVYINYEELGFFEMFNPKHTKGFGVNELINTLGIDKENTYAFGDGENDVEMFQEVKHGIAMGIHHEKLKEHAYDFTENVENEGIYTALKKLELI